MYFRGTWTPQFFIERYFWFWRSVLKPSYPWHFFFLSFLKSDLINALQSFQVKSSMAEYFGIQSKTLILLTSSSWRRSIFVLERMATCLSLIPQGPSTMKGHSMDAFSQTNIWNTDSCCWYAVCVKERADTRIDFLSYKFCLMLIESHARWFLQILLLFCWCCLCQLNSSTYYKASDNNGG